MIRPTRKHASSIAGGAAIACAALIASLGGAAAANPEFTFAMITHGQPGDAFWDIIRKGAEAAAKKDNVRFLYFADPTASKEAQLVTNVVQQHVDGIAVTLAFPDAEEAAVKQAEAAGIPILGFNAGVDDWKKAGLLMYVGQDETIAGEAVGDRLNGEGAKSVICVDQQQGAVQLEERCDGMKKAFHGDTFVLYVAGYDMAAAKSRILAKLQQSPNTDYIVTLGAPFAPVAIDAAASAGGHTKVGTFDLNPQAVSLIKEGKLQWAVDQQPFVEGYEAIDLLWLNKTNGDTLGGGGPVLTGPTFVTKGDVAEVAKFAERGTR